MPACWRRKALGAIPVPLYQDAVAATSSSIPLNNAEVAFAVVEDQEQVDKLLEIRPQCPLCWPRAASGTTIRAACATTTSPACKASLDALVAAGRARQVREPQLFFDQQVAVQDSPTMWRPCSSPRAPPATPRAWCTPM